MLTDWFNLFKDPGTGILGREQLGNLIHRANYYKLLCQEEDDSSKELSFDADAEEQALKEC